MLPNADNPEAAYDHVPPDPAAWLAGLGLRMTINGEDGPDAPRADVIHPGTEHPIATYPEADAAHLEAAVEAAAAAFPAWAAQPWQTRREALGRFADQLQAAQQDFSVILACESGRPLRLTYNEMVYAIQYVRILAAMELPARDLSRPGLRAELKRKALGVVGAIAPWNAPVVLGVAKIANALLVGDTMVLRPSPFTPLSALYMGMLGRGIFPPGVFNVITGDASIGAAMCAHPKIAKISFTGSTATGKKIAAAAAPTLKRLTLELGGNDAAIVLPDADIGALAQTVFAISLRNCGHFCAAIKRLYIHADIYDDVCDALIALTKTAVLGTSFDPAATMGPLQNRPQFDRVWSLFDDAMAEGGRLLTGGYRIDRPGFFMPPTLIDGLDHEVRLISEEQFGPVLPLIRFEDATLALQMANNTTYGLGGSIWTRDIDRGIALANRLEVGTAWVNQHGAFTAALPMPFAKDSGIGIDYAEYGLAEHARAMLVNARLSE
jgi:aldehyde dehydrogenase (NAD+)